MKRQVTNGQHLLSNFSTLTYWICKHHSRICIFDSLFYSRLDEKNVKVVYYIDIDMCSVLVEGFSRPNNKARIFYTGCFMFLNITTLFLMFQHVFAISHSSTACLSVYADFAPRSSHQLAPRPSVSIGCHCQF